MLSFYIDPTVIRQNSSDLTKINHTDSSNHVPEDKIYIGDDLLIHLRDNEGEPVEIFYLKVVNFYELFKSSVLHALKFLDPVKSLTVPCSVFDLIRTTLL